MNFNGLTKRSMTRATASTAMAMCALVACSKMGGGDKNKGQATKAGSGTSPAAGPILVGHYASLTGAEATFGQSTDNGVRLALEERNAAGGVKGRKIEVKTLDTASKASEGKTVVTRLINEDHVVALLGEVASKISLEGGKVAQQYGIPMISPSSTNAKVTELGDMISRVCFIDSFQGYVMAKFAKDELKFTKVAVLFDQAAPYSKGLADDFTAAYTQMGGTVVTRQAYQAGDVDVAAQLGNIKGAGADAVYLPGYYTDVGNIVRQARKQGVTAPFLGGDGWDSSKLVEIGGDAVEGSYYSNHYSFDEARPEVQEFVKKYQAKYGQTPDGLAALGYDAARVLFAAMDAAPSLSGKDLAATIAATRNFPGVTGRITLDGNRNAQKKAVVLQVKGGKPTYVASIAPAGMEEAVPAADAKATGSAAAAGSAAPAPAPAAPAAAGAVAPGAAAPAPSESVAPTRAMANDSATAPASGAPAHEAAPKAKAAKGGVGTKADPDDGGE